MVTGPVHTLNALVPVDDLEDLTGTVTLEPHDKEKITMKKPEVRVGAEGTARAKVLMQKQA